MPLWRLPALLAIGGICKLANGRFCRRSHSHLSPFSAFTGLQPPVGLLINGLNGPPTVDFQKGWSVPRKGEIRGHVTAQPDHV